jgi:hypothetical protein
MDENIPQAGPVLSFQGPGAKLDFRAPSIFFQKIMYKKI